MFAKSSPEDAAAAKAAIRRLKDGRYHQEPHTKNIGNGLYELRVTGTVSVRILFFFVVDQRIVVVHGFRKKTQKLPKSEKEIALNRMRRFREQESSGSIR